MPSLPQRDQALLREIADLRRRVAREETREFAGGTGGVSGGVDYSGTPTPGNYTYWAGVGTVADSGFGTAQLPRYTGTPGAGSLTYWTADGTIAPTPFGTADLLLTSGNQTAAGIKIFSGTVDVTGRLRAEGAAGGSIGFFRNAAAVTTAETIGQLDFLSNDSNLSGTVAVARILVNAASEFTAGNAATNFYIYTTRSGDTDMTLAGYFDDAGNFIAQEQLRAFGNMPAAVYTGTPAAGRLAQWTGAGTLGTTTFGTATIVYTDIDQVITGGKTFSGTVTFTDPVGVMDELLVYRGGVAQLGYFAMTA